MKLLMIALIFLAGYAEAAKIPENFVKSIQLDVEKYTLDNGMTVLLYEDHSVPIISFHQWYRVGSKNEKVGLTGLAHFFEHCCSTHVVPAVMQAQLPGAAIHSLEPHLAISISHQFDSELEGGKSCT